jgi:lipoprotein-anchoring transpeptidase ErfK/SrfK
MKLRIKPTLDHRRGSRFSIYFLSENFSLFRSMNPQQYGEQIIRIIRKGWEQVRRLSPQTALSYGTQLIQILRRGWRRMSLLLASGLVFWLVTLLLLIVFSASPPVAAFARAWMALSTARHAETNIYAPELFRAAEKSWEKATLTWGRENKKWFFRRDFQKAFDLAQATRLQAQQAESTAIATRDSLQFAAIVSLAFVKQKVDEFKTRFNHVPVSAPLRKKFVAGELLMLESELAFRREDFLLSAGKVKQAETLVGSAGSDAKKFLRAYLAKVPEWQRWASETIAWSEQNNALAIVIDKMAHMCQVYLAGKKLLEYPVELGPRWLGHKRQRGDNATPEGHYFITKKKSQRHTQYYKALEINYPNDNDREQFRAAQERGELPRFAQIGGLIEIHGDGGKGVNWTSGCVALRNQDIDKIFDLAEVGSRVTIVGSLKSQPALASGAVVLAKKSLNGNNHHPAASK